MVYLNKVPTSQYRAVGHPIGISVGEHMVDRAAEATGLDPVDIRRRNVMPDDSYPGVAPSGVPVNELSHEACLDKLIELMDYESLRREQAELRERGVHRGIGIAGFIKGTAWTAGLLRVGWCTDRVTGRMHNQIGTFRRDNLHGRCHGPGTGRRYGYGANRGHRVGRLNGPDQGDQWRYGRRTLWRWNICVACNRDRWRSGISGQPSARSEILEMAGILLQSEPETLDIADGHVVDANRENRIPLAEIGRIGHFQLGELPNDYQPVLSATRRYRLTELPYIFTNGIHGAYLEVDPDTGFIQLLKHWVVEDCGRVINPNLADEQVRGGCVQGLGGALFEHCLYDDAAQLLNGSMADYLTPMAAEMPDIVVAHVETPTRV